MGYSLIKDKNVTIKGIKSYLVDSAEDLTTLPVSDMPGSTALVAGTKDTYTLNNSYEWVKEDVEGGGSGLPPVTSEDDGKVLKVIEGAWSKSEPSGGVEIKRMTLTNGQSTAGSSGSYTGLKYTIPNDKIFLDIDYINNDDLFSGWSNITITKQIDIHGSGNPRHLELLFTTQGMPWQYIPPLNIYYLDAPTA